MSRIFIPTNSTEDWKRLLADQETQWKKRFSARTLAHCWQDARGFPKEISHLFATSKLPEFQRIELILALPEYKVPLPGGSRASQNDLFVLAKAQGQLIAITVEGKVLEPFGPTLAEWISSASLGRKKRLAHLKEQLSLIEDLPLMLRYQLLHRTASAVIEARRFCASIAVMLVHSFSQGVSQKDAWFEDYQDFLNLFGVQAIPNKLVFLRETEGVRLYSGWVRGAVKFLEL